MAHVCRCNALLLYPLRVLGLCWTTFVVWLVLAALFVPEVAAAAGDTNFPERPITIVVYTGPGGLIDTTARQFIEIARKHADATFYVRNIPEGSGIAAMKRVLDSPADGYTLFAGTRSNIAKAITSGKTHYLTSLDWIALLMTDPECLITRNDAMVSSWEDVVRDAKAHPDEQIWLGPDAGGLDHVFALRVWEKFGIRARWVPFKSGGEALTNLIGGQGHVYVGNPLDALDVDGLRVALVSSKRRMPEFPDAPTCGEFGAPELDEEIMWRGFAVRAGTPPEPLAWYEDLFRAVSQDPEWRELWQEGGIDVNYRGRDVFEPIIEEDIRIFSHYLQKLDLIQTARQDAFSRWFQHQGIWWAIGMLIVVNGYPMVRRRQGRSRARLGALLIPVNLLCVGLILLAASFTLVDTTGIGPAVVPRLWIGLLIPCCLVLIARTQRDALSESAPEPGDARRRGMFLALLVFYLVLLYLVGYYVATFVFLMTAMNLLGARGTARMIVVSGAWLALSYFLFVRFLQVALPTGWIWQLAN